MRQFKKDDIEEYLDEFNYMREPIYNRDYIKTQEYIEKYIDAEFSIKYGFGTYVHFWYNEKATFHIE